MIKFLKRNRNVSKAYFGWETGCLAEQYLSQIWLKSWKNIFCKFRTFYFIILFYVDISIRLSFTWSKRWTLINLIFNTVLNTKNSIASNINNSKKFNDVYNKAGLAPWFDMLNHSMRNNCEFTFEHQTGKLVVQCINGRKFSKIQNF